MALAETAKLVVDLSLKGNFLSQLTRVNRAVNTTGAKLDKMSSRGTRAGQQIGTGILRSTALAASGVGILVSQIGFGLNSLIKLEQAQAQTNAVLKSTKGIAGQTGAEITRLAEKYEGLNATVGDEFVRAGENMLLTFTKIRGKAFEPALAATLDLNTALGKGPEGLTKTAVLVGKALNDPAKGLTSLSRVGVSFSKHQKKRIAELLKENDVYGAQQVIIRELNKEFGGSFLAQGDTTAGKVAKFGDAIEDLQRNLAVALLPAVSNIADALTELLADPEVIQSTKDLGVEIGKLFSKQNIKDGIGALKEGFGIIKSIAGPIAEVVGAAVKAFTSLPPELQKLAVGALAVNKLTGGLVTNLAGGLISAVLSSFKGVLGVTAGVVNVNGPVAGVPGGGKGGGVGLLGLLGGAGLVAGGLALGQGAATDVNTGLAGKGIKAEFQMPSGFLDIPTQLSNLVTAVKVLTGTTDGLPPRIDARLERDRNPVTGRDSTTQAETTKGNVFGAKGLAQSITEAQKVAGEKTTTAVEGMKSKLAADLKGNQSAILETKREAAKGAAFGQQGITATNSGASTVAAAVRASRPIVNVSVTANSFTTKVNVTDRYGNPNGSRNKGNTNEGGMGGQ